MDPVLGSGQKKGVFWSKVFCTFKSLRSDDGGEYLKDLPDFGYEVQVAGLPEGHQDDGEKDSAVASTARMTTPRPMGAKAAKRAQVQTQNSQKKSKAMAKAVKGMGSKVEDVAKAMREKSVLDRTIACWSYILVLATRKRLRRPLPRWILLWVISSSWTLRVKRRRILRMIVVTEASTMTALSGSGVEAQTT